MHESPHRVSVSHPAYGRSAQVECGRHPPFALEVQVQLSLVAADYFWPPNPRIVACTGHNT